MAGIEVICYKAYYWQQQLSNFGSLLLTFRFLVEGQRSIFRKKGNDTPAPLILNHRGRRGRGIEKKFSELSVLSGLKGICEEDDSPVPLMHSTFFLNCHW